jgi:hypothetical protein
MSDFPRLSGWEYPESFTKLQMGNDAANAVKKIEMN